MFNVIDSATKQSQNSILKILVWANIAETDAIRIKVSNDVITKTLEVWT